MENKTRLKLQDWMRDILRGEVNPNDLFVSPSIPEDVKAKVRSIFEISNDKNILFIRDRSFWNDRTCGLVVTDKRIKCLPDSSKADEVNELYWEQIDKVEYKDSSLIFYFQDDYLCLDIKFFIKSSDDKLKIQIGSEIASLFSLIAQDVAKEKDPFDMAYDKFEELKENGQTDEAIEFAYSFIRDNGNAHSFYQHIASTYLDRKEYDKAIDCCNKGLEYCDPKSELEASYLFSKYCAHKGLGQNLQARADCLDVKINTPDDFKYDGKKIKSEAEKDFPLLDELFVKNLFEQPYSQRKLILPVKEYTKLSQERLSVINIKNLSQIEFPIGHPITNQLYVGHPYLKYKYIPFENYELELIEDKIREFCYIMQCLGAKEINIGSYNNSASNRSSSSEKNTKLEVSYKVVSGEGEHYKAAQGQLVDEISRSISLHQTFTPVCEPYLPDGGLVWYPNEPSWQRIYNQRIHGSLNEHEERIETRKSQVLNSSEISRVRAEVQTLVIKGGGQWDKTEEAKLTVQENVILSIKVVFAGLEEISIRSTPQGDLHLPDARKQRSFWERIVAFFIGNRN